MSCLCHTRTRILLELCIVLGCAKLGVELVCARVRVVCARVLVVCAKLLVEPCLAGCRRLDVEACPACRIVSPSSC